MKSFFSILAVLISTCTVFGQHPIKLDVHLDQSTGKISQNMWGVFFEDINLGADGGIYAELVKNRSFEFTDPLMGWKKQGKNIPEGAMIIQNDSRRKGNLRSLVVAKNENYTLGLQNEGFRGMGIKEGLEYEFSLLYKNLKPGISLKVELLDENANSIGSAKLDLEKTSTWKEGAVKLVSSKRTNKGKLAIWFEGQGSVEVDMLSLFPKDTWKGRKKGLRADMVQVLADMKPGFIRFPGGCIVEGRDLANRFQWKKTVGPIEERELIINRWNTEFQHRLTPDYFQTFGLGFYEYFLLSEDIGAEPVPILNCGMACQFNTAEVVPLDELDEYLQDALDLIEFANGGTHTPWGRLRAEMGHPKPFNLKMLGVGNENWGPQYIERYKIFQEALRNKHPEIRLIASSGTGPDGERFDYLDKELRTLKTDIIDEHYYRPPAWFLSSAGRYDDYDRNGPQIFAGEYASHTTRPTGPTRNSWDAALSEAAFMTGLERNADIVTMASYAPLFGHVDGWQWSPDLIWVDNLNVYGTPSYYVQKLYALNKGTDIIPLKRNGQNVIGQDSIYASTVFDANSKELIIKVANHNDKNVELEFQLLSKRKISGTASKTVIRHDEMDVFNSIDEPLKVKPVESKTNYSGKKVKEVFQPYSFTVIRIPIR